MRKAPKRRNLRVLIMLARSDDSIRYEQTVT